MFELEKPARLIGRPQNGHGPQRAKTCTQFFDLVYGVSNRNEVAHLDKLELYAIEQSRERATQRLMQSSFEFTISVLALYAHKKSRWRMRVG